MLGPRKVAKPMFCPTCGKLMTPKDGKLQCAKCCFSKDAESDKVVIHECREKETLILGDDNIDTMPKTNVKCEKCGNNEAAYHIRQTRAADEPPTRIFRCTKCKHTWREY